MERELMITPSEIHSNSTSSSGDAGYLDVVDPRWINGFSDSPISSLQVLDMNSESQSFRNFTKSPFGKILSFALNKTIELKAKNATRVHVIYFGILYGFQWPTFLQHIVESNNGRPRVRITCIEFPQPGFKLAERIEEIGVGWLTMLKLLTCHLSTMP
ncbi:scarecrow 9 [Olea europaea subsp. europaea]|uniref:Scarecrow 9 n=1 Tax=Olea europaea subsp. europaea TaxID=158383 RepID=A0A8S0QNZ3_OLEEU|nr:scarecrow 9 [Olea europaea subsp. europaea]